MSMPWHNGIRRVGLPATAARIWSRVGGEWQRRSALGILLAAAAACSGESSAPSTPTVPPPPTTPTTPTAPVVASVVVSPATVTLRTGATQTLTAAPRTSAGTDVTGRTVTWTSSATAVATVTTGGVVTAVAPGTATITATVDGIAGTAAITVQPPAVASIAITPATTSLNVGATATLTATVRDAAGAIVTGRTVTWTSSATAVATVMANGVVNAVAPGNARITAALDGVTGQADVAVTGPPASAWSLRDSVVLGTQGFFMGAASADFSRIVVTPYVDASATTRDVLFLDANGSILARHDIGNSSWAVAMTPNGARTVVGSDDSQLYLFEGTNRVSVGRPIVGNTEIRGVAISDDGRWVGAGGMRFTLHDWQATSRITPVYVDSTTTQLRAIDFSADGRYVAYGGRISTSNTDPGVTYLAIYDLQTRTRVFQERLPCDGCANAELRQVAISADGSRVIGGDWGGRLHYWVKNGATWTRTTQSVGSRVYWVDMSQDGNAVAVGVQESGTRRFALSATAATLVWERGGTDGGQRTVHITPDGRFISAATRGGGSGGGQIVTYDASGTTVLSRASYAIRVGTAYKARDGSAEPEAWFARVNDAGDRALLASFHGVLYFFIKR